MSYADNIRRIMRKAKAERTFKIKADVGGRKMACEVAVDSVGRLAEHITERFGIRFEEIKHITVKSNTVTIQAQEGDAE